jgi:hypothetical protein
MTLIRQYDPQEETFLRGLVIPEEDRHLFTTSTWSGGYRWFRSPDVVPIEYYRRPSIEVMTPNKRVG